MAGRNGGCCFGSLCEAVAEAQLDTGGVSEGDGSRISPLCSRVSKWTDDQGFFWPVQAIDFPASSGGRRLKRVVMTKHSRGQRWLQTGVWEVERVKRPGGVGSVALGSRERLPITVQGGRQSGLSGEVQGGSQLTAGWSRLVPRHRWRKHTEEPEGRRLTHD